MKIMILHLFVGTVTLMGAIEPPGQHQLSKRIAGLRFRKNRRSVA